ncbi:hypothetical protein ACFUTX_09840 [Microbacterium sp. NPDC057407]|uniref:hypothetical protein n=1 Tax=Microbacterium sp. NPDC057407 TaxID=3346120 RepID=UPI00366E7C09
MEPLILLVQGWWWVAPAAAGVGAASFAGLTTGRRRARRLELDAARHEESQAYRALVAAKAQVRTAQADVLAARSQSAFSSAPMQARRALQAARDAERAASFALRASRARVKAAYAEYRAHSSSDLPIERLYAAHDAVNARWLAYETDIDKALAFPQLTDPRHPATVAFLRAQREAQFARPTPGRRITPAQFVAYRSAVAAMDAALTEAERQAGVPGAARPPQQAGVAGVLGSVADAIDAAIPVIEGLRSAIVLPRRFSPKPPDSATR